MTLKYLLSRTVLASFCIMCGVGLLQAQIDNTGCVGGNFGVDAGLYSGTIEYGNGTPAIGTTDWFLGTSGLSRISEVNTTALTILLQTNDNPIYEERMNALLSSEVDGQILIDALFARDQFGGTGEIDQTSYNTASKNGEDPAIWDPGPQNVLGKNDLIDVAGHMMRDGVTSTDDLWFFGLINRAEPGGDAYMDFEFFVADVTYSPATGFSSGGPQLGHTAFNFDAAGNITKIGDVIFDFALTNGGTDADLEVRIWVSYTDYTTITPATFSWGAEFDGAFTGAPYGYALIIPLSDDICGYVNIENETPLAPPWGTLNTKYNVWETTYEDYSVGEVGINLTAVGLDHSSLAGADPCYFPLHTYLVKTRASNSFTAQLKDFAGPFTWGQPFVESTIVGDAILSCLNPDVVLTSDPFREDVEYSWTTEDGQIDTDPNQHVITVSQPGTYVLHTVLTTTDCPMPDAASIVTYDETKPFFNLPTTVTTVSCDGNDGAIDLTVSGATPPFSYNWTKEGTPNPPPFATTEDLTGLAAGTYTVTITDFWGCTASPDTVIVPARIPTVITPTVTHVDCHGTSTGAIDILLTGQSPFEFLWSNGQTSQNIINIPAGSYSITVTDADGCTTTASYSVTQPAELTTDIAIVNESDPALNNGSLDLTVGGGIIPYSYAWTGPGGFTATTQDITGLVAGTYMVTVTDANGCTITATAVVFEPEVCNDGIDNDGDALLDCQDVLDCIPPGPGTITASTNDPCVGDPITYSVVDNPDMTSYDWTVPSNATINSGQGTSSIVVTWNTTVSGPVCVQANLVGCLSTPSCINVVPIDVPPAPETINKD